MLPLIQPNDKLIVSPIRNNPDLNNILIFRQNSRLIAHRLIYIHPKKKFFLTKGDNNKHPDKRITKSDILGKVETIKRNNQKLQITHTYLTQSLIYTQVLQKLLSQFSKHHIPYILLKGLPLHLRLEKHPPQRLFTDADILIRHQYLTKVDKILTELNFNSQKPQLFSSNTVYSQISYILKTSPFPVVIDLHLEPAISFTKALHLNRLIPSLEKFNSYLWKNTHQITVNNQPITILKPNALLIYLLIHFFHHNFHGAHRLQFLNLIAKSTPNWGKIAHDLQKLDIVNFIYPTLLLLNKYYFTPIPKHLNPRFSQLLISKLIVITTSPFSSGSRQVEGIKRLLFLNLLSPVSTLKKLRTILSKQTLYFIYLTIRSFFLSSTKNSPAST